MNVRPARATAGSQTNYPGHHGAQDVSLRIALLLFRHSQTRHSELSGVRRRGAPRVAISTKEPALSDPRSRRPPDGSSPGLSLTCTDRPAPDTSYQVVYRPDVPVGFRVLTQSRARRRVRLWHHSPVRQSRPLLRAIDLVQRESVQVSPATRQLMALAQRTLLEKVSPKQAVPDEVWRE